MLLRARARETGPTLMGTAEEPATMQGIREANVLSATPSWLAVLARSPSRENLLEVLCDDAGGFAKPMPLLHHPHGSRCSPVLPRGGT